MKVKQKYMILAVVCVVTIVAPLLVSVGINEFEQISMEKLESLLQGKKDSIIFCTQELCGGCNSVTDYLKDISSKYDITVYKFEVDTQPAKELLYQYGLNQVPAIIIISNGQLNVYKGNLSKESIERAILTESVVYERFNDVVEINYDVLIEKINSNSDFFIYFSNESCSDCQVFSEVLNQYILGHPNSGAYCIDLGKIKSDATAEEYERILNTHYIEWIPYMLHIKNGVELSSYEYPELQYRQDTHNGSVNSEAALAFFTWMDNELK